MSVSAIKSTPAAPIAAAPSVKHKKKTHTAKVPTAAKSAPAAPVKPSGATASTSTSINVKA
jgi:hypothetical protein